MTLSDLALARRLVACPAWRWMPGMLAERVTPPEFLSDGADPDRFVGRQFRVHFASSDVVQCHGNSFEAHNRCFVPVIADPATIGCVLALVREAWREHVSVIPLALGAEWHALHERNPGTGLVISSGPTESAALVAALEAAPKKE